MVTKILKNTFIGGELSNKMQNRFDFSKYSSSAKYIENFNLQKEGNISFRDGSFYIANLNIDNDTIKKVRLLEWIKNETTIYLLVFSNKSLKIYSNFVLLTTLETPYDLENIKNIQIDYCGNNLYIVDGIHTPYFLNNIGNNFTLKFADFSENDGTPPWDDENLSDITLKASAASGNITITASRDLFNDTYLNKFIKIKNAGNKTTGYAKITSIISATVVNATVIKNIPITTAVSDWWVSLAPSTLIFYQSRLWYAKDNRIYASRTQDNDGLSRFNDFTTGADEDYAISLVNTIFKTPILWLKATDRILFAGTTTTLFQINNTSTNGYISPKNLPYITPFSNDGCKAINPLQINNNVFFVSVIGIQNDTGSRLNVVSYSWESEGYNVSNLNIFNENINKEGIIEIAYVRSYDDVVYCLKTNGEISCLNYNANESILGWSRFTSAGYNRSLGKNGADGFIESITSLRQVDGSDLLVLCVRRNINGIIKRYIEYIPKTQFEIDKVEYFTGNEAEDNKKYLYDLFQLQINMCHLDCSSKYDGKINKTFTITNTAKGESIFTCNDFIFTQADIGKQITETFDYDSIDGVADIVEYIDEHNVKINILIEFSRLTQDGFVLSTNKITGLEYLEGKRVSTWVDGGIGGEYIVKDGKIDLQFQGSFILVGLKYIGKIQTLNFNFDNQQGQNSCDLKKSINKINIFFYNTVSCKVGTNPYKLDYKYISPSSILGKVPTIFNGVSTFTVMDTPQQDKSLFFYKDDYSPCTIQFINIHINYA